MKKTQTKTAFAAGIGYTLGNILIKGINILALPIFSRILSTEEFGVFNVFMSYDAILSVIIGFALHSSIRSAKMQFKERIHEYTASVTILYFLNTLLLTVLVILFGRPISGLLGFKEPILYMLIIYSAGSALIMLYNTWVSLDYSYGKYLLVAFINSIGTIGLSLFLISAVFSEQKDTGRILGSTIVVGALTIYLLIEIYRKAKPKYNREFWKYGLKYSLPIVPHGVSQILLAQFDRITIRNVIGDAAAGIYSLAGNIKLILTVITSSISAAWTTWFFEKMEEKAYKEIRQRASQLAVFFSILAIGLMALTPELIYLLGGKAYDQAKFVAIPMVLDALILFFYDLIVSGEYYTKNTVFIMLGTILAAALNVVLNLIFIPRYGFVSAAYTTLAAYLCYLFLHIFISRKLVGFYIIPLKRMLLLGGFCGILAAVDLLLIESLLLRWGICAAVVIPMTLLLLKNAGYLKKRRNVNGEGNV